MLGLLFSGVFADKELVANAYPTLAENQPDSYGALSACSIPWYPLFRLLCVFFNTRHPARWPRRARHCSFILDVGGHHGDHVSTVAPQRELAGNESHKVPSVPGCSAAAPYAVMLRGQGQSALRLQLRLQPVQSTLSNEGCDERAYCQRLQGRASAPGVFDTWWVRLSVRSHAILLSEASSEASSVAAQWLCHGNVKVTLSHLLLRDQTPVTARPLCIHTPPV
jgi:hypothetical protein